MRSEDELAFPHLPAARFDRWAHERDGQGQLDKTWDPSDFPFDHRSLPRLPEIKNSEYALLARTHRSLPTSQRPDDDPETQSLNYFETIGDSLLSWAATIAIRESGCVGISGDVVALRGKLVSNVTLSYVAWSYRLHHGFRHAQQMNHPHQKLFADMFEAYIGAAYCDAKERGCEREVDDYLAELFKPEHWPAWAPLQKQLAKTGRERRLTTYQQQKRRKLEQHRRANEKKQRFDRSPPRSP